MNKKNKIRYNKIDQELKNFHANNIRMNGITNAKARDILVKQIIDSIRRIEYINIIENRDINIKCEDPSDVLFDPIKAAILKKRNGQLDESFWLVFLSINYGKNLKHGWRMTRDIYGRLQNNKLWTWDRTSKCPEDFTTWINDHHKQIQSAFGNHRKYESLRPDAQRSPAKVVTSYIDWVGPTNSHSNLINSIDKECNSDARLMFSQMYKSMSSVLSFGRTSKFDYLTMIAKIGLVNIEPGSVYLNGATGPLLGAKLLFTGKKESNKSISELEKNLVELEMNLSIGKMGMQVLEDSLCNWQKSPRTYINFRG